MTDELPVVVQRMSLSVILFGGLMAVQPAVAWAGYHQLSAGLLIAAVTAGVSVLYPVMHADLKAGRE